MLASLKANYVIFRPQSYIGLIFQLQIVWRCSLVVKALDFQYANCVYDNLLSYCTCNTLSFLTTLYVLARVLKIIVSHQTIVLAVLKREVRVRSPAPSLNFYIG